jgi:SAM-dependent methyltransferase
VNAADPQFKPRRANLRERTQYIPGDPQEEFVVPLLAARVEAAIARWASPESSAKSALDVGCGGQPFRARLEGLGYRYTGLDPTPSADVTVDVVCTIDMESLPEALLERAPFEFILCTEVLEHVADWGTAMRNLAALTAPGGRLLLTCPAVYPLHEEPHDFWRPTLHAFAYYARREGLTVIHEEAAGDALDVLGTILGATGLVPARSGLAPYLAARAADWLKRRLFKALLGDRLRAYVSPRGSIYLSNVVVLEQSRAG